MTATPIDPCSNAITNTVEIQLTPSPEAFAGANKTICEDENVDLSDATWANGATFSWTSSNAGSFIYNGTNPGEVEYVPNITDIQAGGTVLTLSVTGEDSCGSETVTSQVPITIHRVPTVFAGPENQLLCEGANTINGALVDYEESLQWSSLGDGILTNPSSLSPIYTPGPNDLINGSVTLTLTANAFNGCSAPVPESIVFQVNAAPEANAGPNDKVCANSPYLLSGATATNYSAISWSTSGTGGFDSTSGVTPLYTPSPGDIAAGFVELTMTVTQDGCATISDRMELTIVPEAVANAGVDINICQGESAAIVSATASNFSSLSWEVVSGSGSLQNPTTTNPTYIPNNTETGNVVLRLTANPLTDDNVNCGGTAVDTMTINITAAPTTSAGPNQTICEGENFSFVGTGAFATNYNQIVWRSSGDGFFTNGNSIEPTYTPGPADLTSGQVRLQIEALPNAPCVISEFSEMVLTITQIPEVDAGPIVIDYCEDDTVVTLTDATAEYQDSISWNTSGSGSFSPSASDLNPQYTPSAEDIASGAVVLTLTGTQNPTNCGASSSDTITINFIALPQATAGADATICDNNTYTINDASADHFASVTWTSSGTGNFINNSITNATYVPSPADIALGAPIELTLSAVGIGPCEEVSSDSMLLTLAPSPEMEIGEDRLLCEDTSLVIDLTQDVDVSNVDINTYQWTSTGTGTFVPANTLSTTYQPSPQDITAGNTIVITLTAQPIAPCATPITDSFNLDIIANPTADAGPDEITICESGHTFGQAIATNFDNIQWVNETGTGAIQNSTSPNATYIPSQADITAGTVTIKLIANPLAPCGEVAEDQILITIEEAPEAYAGDDATICEGDTFTLVTATAENFDSLLWSAPTGGTFANGTTLTPTFTPSVAEILAGEAVLVLTAQPESPCAVPVTDIMVLTIQNQPDVEAGDDTTICEGETYQTNTATLSFSSGATWTTNGSGTFTNAGALDTTYSPSQADINAGSVVLTLTADAVAPCVNPIADVLTLTITPKATVSITPDTATICATDTYSFDASQIVDEHVVSYLWESSGDGVFSDDEEEAPTYTPGSGDILNGGAILTLSVDAEAACINPTASDSFALVIDPTPTIDLSASETTICFGAQLNITSTIANADTITWEIVSGGGTIVSGGNSENPIYEPAADSELVRLRVTATGLNPCTTSLSQDLEITVTQLPEIVTFATDAESCDSAPYAIAGVTTNGNEANVIWSTTGTGAFSNLNIQNPTYTPTAADVAAGFVDLTMVAVADSPCLAAENVPQTFRLTLTEGATVYAGADDTLCVDSDYVITDATETNTASLIWTSNGTGTWQAQNSLNATYTPSDIDKADGFFILTLTGTGNGSCPDVLDTKRIDIIPTPVVDLDDTQNYCTNEPGISISPLLLENYSSVEWRSSSSSGTFASTSTTTTTYYPSAEDYTNGQVTITLIANPLTPCLEAEEDTLVLTFAQAPVVDAGVDQTVCEDQNVVLNAAADFETTLAWTTDGSGTFLNNVSNTLNPTYVPSAADVANGSVKLTLTATGNASCDPSIDDLTVSFAQNPEVIIGSDLTFCENDTVTFSDVTYTNVAGILWQTSGLGVLSNETTANPSYTPALNEIGVVEFNLTVQAEAPCTDAQTFTKSVTFVAAPTVNAGADIAACETDGTITITDATATAGANVSWRVITGGSTLLNNTSLTPSYTPTAQDYINGEVRIELRAFGTNGCADATDELIIALTPTPIVDAGVDATVCQDASFTTTSAAVIHSNNFIWSTPDGSGTLVAATNDLTAIYTPAANEVGTIRLVLTAQADNGCSAVITDELLLTINPPATANANTDQELCVGDIVTLSGAVTNQSAYEWSTTGSGSFVPSINDLNAQYQPAPSDFANGSVTLTLTATGLDGCTDISDSMVANFAPIPEVFAGNDAEICVGEAYDLTDATTINGQNIQWTAVDGDGSFDNLNSVNTIYTPGSQDLIDGTVTLRLTATGINPCDTVVSDEVTLVITALPELTVQSSFDICEGAFTITGTNATNYDTIDWQIINGDGSLQFSDQLVPVYTTGANDATNGSVTLRATVAGQGACTAATAQKDVTLTVNPSGAVNAGLDMVTCEGNPYTFNNGAVVAAVENIRWTHDGIGTISSGQNTMTPTYTPANGENGIITFTLEADEISPCNGVLSDNLTLELVANPQADAGASFTTCAGDIALNGVVSNASGFAWSGGNGTFTPDNTSSLVPVYSPTVQELDQGFVSIILTAEPNVPCATQSTSLITVYFETAVSIDAGPATASVCAGDSYPLDLATISDAASITWSTSGSGSFSPTENDPNPIYTPSATDIANGEVILQLSADGNSNCPTVTDEIVLSIQPLPQISILESSVIFCNDATSINITGVSGEHYDPLSLKWTTNGEGTFVDDTVLNPVYFPQGADLIDGVTLYVQVTGEDNKACSNAISTDEIAVIFTPAPEVYAGANAEICLTESTYTISDATKGDGANIEWTTSGTGSFDNSLTLNPTYTPSALDIVNGTVELTLVGTGGLGCTTVDDKLTLTLTKNPTITLSQNIFTNCSNEIEVPITGVTIQDQSSIIWSHNGQGSFKVSNTALNQVYVPGGNDIDQGVTLTLTAYGNGACTTPTVEQISLNFVDEVIVDAGTDQIAICANETFQISNVTVANAISYEWTNTGGDGVFSETTTNLNPIYTPGPNDISNGSVNLRLTGYGQGNCTDVYDEITLTIDPTVNAFAGNDTLLCSSETSFTLSDAFATNQQAVSWSRADGSTDGFTDVSAVQTQYFFSSEDKTAGFVTLVLRGFGDASCSNTVEDSITLTFVPEVELFAGADASVCYGSPYVVNDATVTANSYDAISWSTSGSGILRFANTISPEYTPSAGDLASGNNQVTLTMSVTPKSECGAAPMTSAMTLTIDQNVTGTGLIQGTDTVCEGDTTTYTLTGLSGETNYNWIAPAGATIISGQGTDGIVVTFDSYNQNTSVQLTVIASNDCPNSDNTIVLDIDVSADPELALISGSNQAELCYNESLTPVVYELKGGTDDVSIEWFVGGVLTTAPTGISFVENATTVEINGAPNATITSDTTYTYKLTATTVGCTNTDIKTGEITLKATPSIGLEAGSDDDQSICEGDAISDIRYTLSNVNDYTFNWTGSTPVGFTINYDVLNDVLIISGVSQNISQETIYTYSILPENTTTGCTGEAVNGQITVNADGELTLDSSNINQTLCENDAIDPILFTIGGDATNVTLTSTTADDLSWINLSVSSGVVTLSGTPTVDISSTTEYNFTVTTIGSGCQEESISGKITTTPTPRIEPSATNTGALSQVACEGTPIQTITLDLVDVAPNPAVTVTNLPEGVYFNTIGNTVEIAGTPLNMTRLSSYNFIVSVASVNGGCVGTIVGNIQVHAQDEFSISTPGTDFSTYCVGDPIAPITYQYAGGTVGASIQWEENGVAIGSNPQGISTNFGANSVTISGSYNIASNSSNVYTYTITSVNSGLCSTASVSGALTFEPKSELFVHASSNQLNQQLCEGEAISDIVFEASSDVDAVRLSWDNVPNGVSGQFNVATGLFTISGSAQNINTDTSYTYTVIAENQSTGCTSEVQTGILQVFANHELRLVSGSTTASQVICEGTQLPFDIVYEFVGGATSAQVAGLNGTGFNWVISGSQLIISGVSIQDITTDTVLNYVVETTGNSCDNVSIGGTITLKPDSQLEHVLASGATNQIICEGDAIDDILYEVTEGFWDYTVSGLPNGVSHSIDPTTNIITITGTPSENITSDQTYNYVIKAFNETSCDSPELNGIINVTAGPALTNTGSSATLDQAVCIDTAIDKISLKFTNSTVPTVSNLPAGLATQVVGDVLEITGSIATGGTYNFNVTANNAVCTNTIAIPIKIEVQPNFSILSQTEADYNENLTPDNGKSRVKNIACYGERTGEIKVEMSDNSITYLYSWTGPNNYSNTTTSNVISNLLPGTYTVSVSAIQTSDCSVSETFVVREPDPLQIVTNEIIPVSCDGVDDGVVSVTAKGGNTDFYKQLTWYHFEEGSSCFTYEIRLKDADNDGIFDIVDADIDNDNITDNGKVDSNNDGIMDSADTDLDGAIDPNYELSSISYQNCGSAQFTNLSLVIDDFSSNGILLVCARPNSVSSNDNLDHDLDSTTSPISSVTITGGDTSCSSGNWVEVSELRGSSYGSGLKKGLYKVILKEVEFSTNIEYCEIEKTFEVAKNEITYANIEVSNSYCVSSSGYIDLDVNATAANVYFYYNTNRVPDINVSIISETFAATRCRINILNPVDGASLEIQDEFGCGVVINSDLLDISVNDPSFNYTSPEFESYGTISERTGVSFTLEGINSYDRIEWDFGDASPIETGVRTSHQYQAEGTYDVTLTAYNSSGCFKTSVQEITIGKGYSLLMPNTFTPNNDGINDRIGPEFTGLKEVNFYVYNKAGVLIYEEIKSENGLVVTAPIVIDGWDGSNSDPNSNYYVYKIIATRLNDEIVTDVGTILLLK